MHIMKELDLQKQPFARAGSRFLIFEKPGEDGGLFVSIASASLSMFGGSGDPLEVLKIEIMEEGETVPFEYCADPFCLTVKGKKGTARFAIDGYYMVVEGHGLTVHFSAKKGGAFLSDSIKMTVDGALIPIKGVKMTVIQEKGSQELIAPWDPKLRGSANPDLYLRPDESGDLKSVIIDQSHSEEEYVRELTVDGCAAEAKENYESFAKKLIPLPQGNEELFFALSYSLWSGLQPTADGVQLYCTNKVCGIAYLAREQAEAALAFSDPTAVLETLCLLRPYLLPDGGILGEQRAGRNIYVSDVPLLGLAAYHAVSLDGAASVARDVLQRAYDMLVCRAEWWIENRSDGNGRFWYAYRRESGSVLAPCFDAGEPVSTPDLAACMCLLFTALSRMARIMEDGVSAEKWQKLAERELQIIRELWNGREFMAVSESGTEYPCGELGEMPAVLGVLLPQDIARAFRTDFERSDLIRTCLLVKGLYGAGVTEPARKTAEEILKNCSSGKAALRQQTDAIEPGANYSPAACASVLSLGSIFSA